MAYRDKLKFILNEIRILTGLDTSIIICDNRNNIRFITDKKRSRVIDLTHINSKADLVLYSKLVCLDLTRSA